MEATGHCVRGMSSGTTSQSLLSADSLDSHPTVSFNLSTVMYYSHRFFHILQSSYQTCYTDVSFSVNTKMCGVHCLQQCTYVVSALKFLLSAGAVALGGGLFRGDTNTSILSQLNCTGQESRLQDCSGNVDVVQSGECDHAVAVCQGTVTIRVCT